MNIKTELNDDLLASENTFRGHYHPNDELKENSNNISDDLCVKTEPSAEDKYQKSHAIMQHFQIERIDTKQEDGDAWRNRESELFHENMKIEKVEFGECSNVEMTPEKNSATYSSYYPVPPLLSSTSNELQITYEKIESESFDVKKEISNHQPMEEVVINLERIVFYERNFVCNSCSNIFPTNPLLQTHQNVHERSQIIKNVNSLEDNIRFELDHCTNRFKCRQCEYTSANKSHIKNHQLKHSSEKQFKCDKCDFKSTWRSTLIYHKQSHTGGKLFKCGQCDFKSAQRCNLKHHTMTHSGEKPFECDLCDFKTARKSYIKQHKKTHSGERPIGCDQCDFKFARLSTLKIHKLTHTGEKRFKCDLCNKRYSCFASLKKHKLSHTRDRPFKCDRCDFKCTSKYNLKTHLMIHFGKQPYECDFCGYKSAWRSTFETHKLSHTGEKPFKCDQCNFTCSRKGNIKLHKKIHSIDKTKQNAQK